MFVTRILFHLKGFVRHKHSLSFKTLVMLATCILFHLKRSYCSRRAISFIQNVRNVRDTYSYYIALCTSQQLLRIFHIFAMKFFHESFKINTNRNKQKQLILVITEKCQLLQRKILLSNLSFESETIFSPKIIS